MKMNGTEILFLCDSESFASFLVVKSGKGRLILEQASLGMKLHHTCCSDHPESSWNNHYPFLQLECMTPLWCPSKIEKNYRPVHGQQETEVQKEMQERGHASLETAVIFEVVGSEVRDGIHNVQHKKKSKSFPEALFEHKACVMLR